MKLDPTIQEALAEIKRLNAIIASFEKASIYHEVTDKSLPLSHWTFRYNQVFDNSRQSGPMDDELRITR